MKVQIEATERQAKVIMVALDLVSRIGCGQLKEIDNTFNAIGVQAEKGKEQEVRRLLNDLKYLYFPELTPDSSYGIFSNEIPDESRVSWDMIQTIRHAIAWHNQPEGGVTVDFGTPIQSSPTEPLLSVTIVES